MTDRAKQAGDGKLGCILWSLLLIAGVMVALKAVPVKIATSELYDFMVEQAKWAGNTPSEVLQKRIVSKGNELELPVDPKFVMVEKVNDKIRMSASFTVPLEFPGYTYEWDFDLQVERPIFIW
jgi:long-subunit fatty acid transport protein